MREKKFRVPKMWHADLIRTRLIEELGESGGENEYQKLVTVIYARKLLPPTLPDLTRGQLEMAVEVVTRPAQGDYRKFYPAGRAFQRWFLGNPRQAKQFVAWAQTILAAIEAEETGTEQPAEAAQPSENGHRATTTFPVMWEDESHLHGTRKCNVCLRTKEVNAEDRKASEFYMSANGHPHGRCKDCTAQADKDRNAARQLVGVA